jgi:hypothetical protein
MKTVWLKLSYPDEVDEKALFEAVNKAIVEFLSKCPNVKKIQKVESSWQGRQEIGA